MALNGVHEAGPLVTDPAHGKHFACTLSALIIARVLDFGGPPAVGELLVRSGTERSVEYLTERSNWIAFAEAQALFEVAREITHHPALGIALGQDAARRLNHSPLATTLRSLGSPEAIYRAIAVGSSKFSSVITSEVTVCEPGLAEILVRPSGGLPRAAFHCEWSSGLLTGAPILFGQPPAELEHTECAVYGADACRYVLRWDATLGHGGTPASIEELGHLRNQLTGMNERLHSMFQTTAELIGAGEIDDVLAGIAERAAAEVRAPRYMLAVRATPGGPLHCHQNGFAPSEVLGVARRLLEPDASLPESWLTVPVVSSRAAYGVLMAACDSGVSYFEAEAELFEVYARYAATAMDSAGALRKARARYDQSSALLELSRALALAGTSDEVAQRLADSSPVVVDCDVVAVYVWDGAELVRRALTGVEDGQSASLMWPNWAPTEGSRLRAMLANPQPEPVFLFAAEDPTSRRQLERLGLAAAILVPLVSAGQLLGVLSVAVRDRAERLIATPDLLDRLSGLGAQGATALQNGRLVDLISYQALHDQLTGLANRAQFTAELTTAIDRAGVTGELAALFYVDLDRFKPVNDGMGHEAGDELLVAVAERLHGCTRATDIAARLGGDEFAVLVCAHDLDAIDRVGDRIVAAFDEPFVISGQETTQRASVGRALFPRDADGAESLLRCADEAMFVVKRGHHSGRPSTVGVAA